MLNLITEIFYLQYFNIIFDNQLIMFRDDLTLIVTVPMSL